MFKPCLITREYPLPLGFKRIWSRFPSIQSIEAMSHWGYTAFFIGGGKRLSATSTRWSYNVVNPIMMRLCHTFSGWWPTISGQIWDALLLGLTVTARCSASAKLLYHHSIRININLLIKKWVFTLHCKDNHTRFINLYHI